MSPARGSRAPRGCPGRRTYAVPVLLASVGTLACAGQLVGQVPRLELDLSATRIEYDTLAPLDAPSVAALAEWQRPSWFGRVTGGLTTFEGGGWSVQGRGNLAWWLAPLGVLSPLRVEAGGSAGGSHHSFGFDSFVARTDFRLHLYGRSAGAWLGASLARARNSFDTASVGSLIPSLGAWAQTGSVRASLAYMRPRVSGSTHPEAHAALTLSQGRLDLTVFGGLRDSPVVGFDERWAGVSGALWLGDHAAIVLAGGKYGADLLQALPGGEFVSIGLRLTPRRSRPIPVSAAAPIVYTTDQTRSGGLGFRVSGAARVEIAGDWNAWIPEPMRRDASGRWLLPAAVGPGVYRFNLRVDGDRWIVPEEVPSVEDGYGGRVGLLIVSEPE